MAWTPPTASTPSAPDKAAAAKERREAVRAQMKERSADRKEGFKMPNGATVKACGGGDQQLEDADA